MAKKEKMARADVEAEIRRTGEHGTPSNPIPEGGPYPSEDGSPKLDDADLRGVDLSRLDLGLASLKRADLGGAILEDANLAGAALDEANLTNTTRTRGAIFTGATMYRARLGGADLSQAVLRRENPAGGVPSPVFIEYATYNDATRWPEGFDPKEHGAWKAEPAEPS